MTQISIMQGRLLPQFEGRFQAFPANNWEKEFEISKKLGLFSIEWIYEHPNKEKNPISSDKGIGHIKELIKETKVQIKSICADYFMTKKLIDSNNIQTENLNHLIWLVHQGKKLGVTYIVLPFVDSSSLKTENERGLLINLLKNLFDKVENLGIEIHLEADLKPPLFKEIFTKVSHPLLKMNYDIGNSSALGYDVGEEMLLLGKYLGSVHIKDRIFGGKTVFLGEGNADFKKCFEWFRKLKFDRWYVLQAAREKEGSEERYISSVMKTVEKFSNES